MGTRGRWSVLGELALLLLVEACGSSSSEGPAGVGGSTSAGGGATSASGADSGGQTTGGGAGGAGSGGSGSASGGGGANGGASGGLAGSGGSSGSNEPDCALMQFHGEGYTLSVLGTGELASLQISAADFTAMAESDSPLATRWPLVVAPYFKKVFFWHLFTMHEHASDNVLLGQNHGVTSPARGVGLGEPNEAALAGQTQLTALIYGREDVQLGSSTMLHELTHTWGNFILPELEGGHWTPLSDVSGFLGGASKRNGITDLGNGMFNAVRRDPNGGTSADIEMYLAGLWPKEKVAPFHWVRNAEWISENEALTEDLYSGDELVTVTVDEVIAKFGAREPDASKSVRDFRMLPIIVTDVPLTPGDWDFYRWQLAFFQAATPQPPYDSVHVSYFSPPNLRRSLAGLMQENFRAAMHEEATLKTDELIDTLTAPGECVPELPGAGNGCARLAARAQACGIANAECHLDREFTTTDGACIASCAEQASCEMLTVAAAGYDGNLFYNDYTWCAEQCQCLRARNCYKAE